MTHNDTVISKFTQSFFSWTVSRIILSLYQVALLVLTSETCILCHCIPLHFVIQTLSHFINILFILTPLIKALNNILPQSWQFCSSCSSLSMVRFFALKLELVSILSNFICIIKKTHKNKNQKMLNHISFIKKTKEKQQAKFKKHIMH